MTNPLVSIIMLTYNREQYLPESIASVLSQTFRDFELIIIDDGSDDHSENLIKNTGDARVRYYKFPHTGRASHLLNIGMEKTVGKFIAFIDSDDVWLPQKLERQMERLHKNKTALFTFTNVIEFNDDKEILRNGIYKTLDRETFEGNIFNDYVRSKFPIYPSTLLFDRRCLQKVDKFSEVFAWTQNDFFHRLAFYYDAFIIYRPLVKIRKHAGNISTRIAIEDVDEMLYMLRSFRENKMISNWIFRKMTSHFYYRIGILNMQARNYPRARKAFVTCLRYNPFRAKAWIRSVLSFLKFSQHP